MVCCGGKLLIQNTPFQLKFDWIYMIPLLSKHQIINHKILTQELIEWSVSLNPLCKCAYQIKLSWLPGHRQVIT